MRSPRRGPGPALNPESLIQFWEESDKRSVPRAQVTSAATGGTGGPGAGPARPRPLPAGPAHGLPLQSGKHSGPTSGPRHADRSSNSTQNFAPHPSRARLDLTLQVKPQRSTPRPPNAARAPQASRTRPGPAGRRPSPHQPAREGRPPPQAKFHARTRG